MTTYEAALLCPKCKKEGLVRLEHDKQDRDIFECVYCHYKDDLTKRSSQPAFKNLPDNSALGYPLLSQHIS